MISVGLVGTSWWSDFMYLSALEDHPLAQVTALCGRNRERAQEVADKRNIPQVYTDYEAMIASGDIQAIVIATPNDSHYPIAMRALDAGLHVLCEKPLALNYTQARQMADLAAQKGVKTLVPFTWRFMPNARYLKELVDNGYLGKPYHCDLRYYNNYARDGKYMWRFDAAKAGSGALGDLGSHHIHIAQWLFGSITHVSAQIGTMIPRSAFDPDGNPYRQDNDTATLQFEFENGASGFFYGTAVGVEDAHVMEFTGSDGTLYSQFSFGANDQRISGMKAGEEAAHHLPIPNHIWDGANPASAMDTLTHVFFKRDWMTRGFITAIAEDKAIEPNFRDGASVQRVLDAALKSHEERRWVDVDSIH